MSMVGKPLLKNPSKKTLYMRAWTAANPEYAASRKAYRKAYYARTREKALADAAKWHQDNSERSALTKHLHYEQNKDRYIHNAKRWIEENYERHLEYQRRFQNSRRALVACGEVDFDAVIARCNNVCGICQKAITGKFHFDHVIPLARGGLHVTDNVQQAHGKCNQIKCARVNFTLSEAA